MSVRQLNLLKANLAAIAGQKPEALPAIRQQGSGIPAAGAVAAEKANAAQGQAKAVAAAGRRRAAALAAGMLARARKKSALNHQNRLKHKIVQAAADRKAEALPVIRQQGSGVQAAGREPAAKRPKTNPQPKVAGVMGHNPEAALLLVMAAHAGRGANASALLIL